MKYLITTLLFSIYWLTGCSSEENKTLKNQPIQNYSTEEEKVFNETFLKIIGTDLYFKISEHHLNKIHLMEEKRASEKEIREYYDKYKKEDLATLIVFTRDGFLDKYTSHNSAKSLHPTYLSYVHDALEQNDFIQINDSTSHILKTLSQPLEISSFNLTQKGRYELVRENDKEKVKGGYKTFGSFNASRIYIDNEKKKAAFFYERDCMEGTKCSSGTLVLLKKDNNQWYITKQISIYQT